MKKQRNFFSFSIGFFSVCRCIFLFIYLSIFIYLFFIYLLSLIFSISLSLSLSLSLRQGEINVGTEVTRWLLRRPRHTLASLGQAVLAKVGSEAKFLGDQRKVLFGKETNTATPSKSKAKVHAQWKALQMRIQVCVCVCV